MAKDVIDGGCTTKDWERVESGICVLPVGAFEQHSHHLPLRTDILLAEHFGEMIARELEAALLPAIPIATSLEHSGFRGTFSLRPETLMAVIRDIADEAERQGFRTMVVVNCHGGNFCVAPTVRDINRLDRPIKLIHCYPPEHVEREGDEVHSGEWETSVMLAMHPDLVGDDRRDIEPGKWTEKSFRRPDLNHVLLWI